jgi:hypothetical protein
VPGPSGDHDNERLEYPEKADRVFHQKFGYGDVLGVKGPKVVVIFQSWPETSPQKLFRTDLDLKEASLLF